MLKNGERGAKVGAEIVSIKRRKMVENESQTLEKDRRDEMRGVGRY